MMEHKKLWLLTETEARNGAGLYISEKPCENGPDDETPWYLRDPEYIGSYAEPAYAAI